MRHPAQVFFLNTLNFQCEINENGNINVSKMAMQPNSVSPTVSFNNTSIPVSLVSSAQTGITSSTNVQDLVMQVELTKEEANNLKR